MTIHIDILAELERRSVQKATDQLDRAFRDMSVGVGVDVKAAEIKAAAAKIQKEFSNLRAEIKVDVDRTALSNMARLGDALSNISSGAAQAHQNLQTLGTTAMKTARGLGTLGTVPAALVLIETARAATTATQSILMLPAAATAAAAGIGTLNLATAGFVDTIGNVRDTEKFAEGLQKLSPNAQQAALSIRNLLPELDRLQQSTQDSFFRGFGENIKRLSDTYLPSIQTMTNSIADSFNRMATGISTELMQPETQAQMKTIMDNISAAFENLVPAARSFTQAFVDITEVGSGFLPGLAKDVSTLASDFAGFIREAKDSGKLKEWIQEGIDAVKLLGEAIFYVGKFIFDVFGSDGKQNVEDFKNTLDGIRTVLGPLTGDFSLLSNDIQDEMEGMTGTAAVLRDAILDIPEALAFAFNKGIDALNFFKHGLDQVAQNAHNFISMIMPGEQEPFVPLPDIPHVPSGGSWNQYHGTPDLVERKPGTYRDRFGNQRRLPGQTLPPSEWEPSERPSAGPRNFPADQWQNISSEEFNRIHGIAPGVNAGPGGMQLPGQFPGGFEIDPQKVTDAQARVQAEQADIEEHRLRLLELEAEGNASQRELLEAKRAITEDETALSKAQRELADAQQGTWKKLENQANNFASGMEQIGVAIDADFGLSKGLAGLAENLFAFVANLAAAPILGPLAAISQAQGGIGRTGSGLMGIAAAQGAFGPQYTPAGMAAAEAAGGTGGGAVPTGLGGLASAVTGAGYAGDAALLANVVAGRYVSEPGVGDLTQGIGDCSSAVEDLVNILDDQPTSGRELSTYNADEWLTQHGFLPGSQAGAFNVGFNSNHMQATLPGGTPFNWGGDASAARGGVGGSGAFDPAFTSHYYRPVGGGGGHSANWDAVAGSESSGSWDINSGNGFSGGLQFTPSSWAAAGGTQYAPEAWMATPEEQKAAADRLLAMQGPGAWPATSAAHPEWFQPTPGATPGLYSPENTDPRLNNPRGYAKGGAVPAILHRGEHVLNRSDVSAMGGQKGVYNFRNALHYDKGGAVNPFLDQYQQAVTGGNQPPGSSAPSTSIFALPSGLGGPSPGAPPGAPQHSGSGAPPGPGEIGKQGPSPIGGGEPKPVPGGSAGAGGGLFGAAAGAAAMAADVMAPGSGAAVQIAAQEIQRAIKFGTQVAGIAAQGLMDTFIPFGGSDLASNNWINRIGGAFAGMAPQIPNLAGTSHSADTMEQANAAPVALPPPISSGQGTGPQPGPNINVTYNNNGASEDRAGADLTSHLRGMYSNMPAVSR